MLHRTVWWGLLALAQWNVEAETLRVCQSGCPYSSIQAAMNAAASGDVIEVEAGQVFVESLRPPAIRNVLVRSSRWSELPPLEERIDPEAHAALLPTVRMPNRFSTALSMGQEESVFAENGVNTTADTIRFETAFGFAENTAVVCGGSPSPSPIAALQKYFLRNWNPATRTGQLALTPGGPPVDLRDQGSAGSTNFYVRPRCTAWDSGHDWTFRGIRFEAVNNPGGEFSWLVNIGSNQQPAREMGPNNIRFHQVVLTGEPAGLFGPSFCLVLAAGSGHEVRSSWIGHCKATGGIESKAIWLQNVDSVEIKNNYVSAASINILTAGGDSARGDVVRNIRIVGNLVEKPGYMMYREGAGAPSGECYYGGGSGAFYRRTDVTPNTCANGACYTCQQNATWALDTTTFYRPGNFLTKNLIELKDCEGCVVEGNLFRGSYVGPDAGQGACASITAATGSGFGSGYHRNYDVTFQNNWCDQVYGGLSASNGVIDGPGFSQLPMRNIVMENNLVTNFARFPALSQWPSPSDVRIRNFVTGQAIDGLRFNKNTFRPSPGATARNGVAIGPGSWPQANFIAGLEMRDNIFQFDGSTNQCAFCISFPPAESNSCSEGGVFRFIPESTEKQVRNNLFSGGNYVNGNDFVQQSNCTARMFTQNEFTATVAGVGFASAANSRLAPTSPYSASNPNAILLAKDGTDLGTDVDVLEMYTKPAEQGKPSMPEQLKLSVETGTTQAVLHFVRPNDASCSVQVYSAPARISANLIGDTGTPERQASNREGNVVSGADIQFLVGSIEALAAGQRYQYYVNCGELWAIGWFRTRTSADTSPNEEMVIEAAAADEEGIVEASSNSSFSAPQVLGPAMPVQGQVTLRLPGSSTQRYLRYRIQNAQGQVRKQSTVRIRPAR